MSKRLTWKEKEKRRVERYDAKNPGARAEVIKRQQRDYRLRRTYGISDESYRALYDAQDGKCAICRNPHEALPVDHCHETGRIRGLLCRSCNVALGLLKEDVWIVLAMVKYIEGKCLPTKRLGLKQD